MKKALNHDENQLFQDVSKRLLNNANQITIAELFTGEDLGHKETDLSTLTAKEIMDKINDHLTQKTSDINDLLFLQYLAAYPVSMCKREISPMLRILIGFHYRLSLPEYSAIAKTDIEKVSYDDLAEIFGRSKATISECILKTEPDWYKFLEGMNHEETPLQPT